MQIRISDETGTLAIVENLSSATQLLDNIKNDSGGRPVCLFANPTTGPDQPALKIGIMGSTGFVRYTDLSGANWWSSFHHEGAATVTRFTFGANGDELQVPTGALVPYTDIQLALLEYMAHGWRRPNLASLLK